MSEQDYLYSADIGIRGIEATFSYEEDISSYDFTIEWTNLTTGITGTWTPTSATWADGLATVRYVPSAAIAAGNYSFKIEVKSGSNEFNVGPFGFKVK